MRVIAGTARGRRLQVPRGEAVRPTADRVREALASALAEHLPGAAVLDLYAGTGALGIEALSRGAVRAVLVDTDPRAVAAARANVAHAGVADRAVVLRADAVAFCADAARAGPTANGPFDLVLVDPPYVVGLGVVYGLLADLERAGALGPGARIVVERDRRDPTLHTVPPRFLCHERDRSYGDTLLRYLRRADPGPHGPDPRGDP